jgi:E3 ubiquitin-protein ligase MGRN1
MWSDMGGSHSSTREAQVLLGSGSRTSGPSRPELSRTGVIRNAINVRKSSFKLVKNELTFRFDCSESCKLRIHFNCQEYLDSKKFPILGGDMDPLNSEVLGPGLDQAFTITVPEECVREYDDTKGVFPIAIETVPDTDTASQLTYISLKNGKPVVLKQKLRYGDRGYELHEIFGRNEEKSPVSSVGYDDVNGTDCVICLSNPRDTTIIPCLHLCLCSQCAQVLSLNTRKCPVCRAPATGLLQIDRDLPPPSPVSPGRAVKISD